MHLCSPVKLRTAFPRIPFLVEFKLARFAKWSSEFGVRPSTQRCPVGPACPQSPPVPCPACLPDCRPCQLSAVLRPPPHTSIEQPPPRPLSMAPFSNFPTGWGLPTTPGLNPVDAQGTSGIAETQLLPERLWGVGARTQADKSQPQCPPPKRAQCHCLLPGPTPWRFRFPIQKIWIIVALCRVVMRV